MMSRCQHGESPHNVDERRTRGPWEGVNCNSDVGSTHVRVNTGPTKNGPTFSNNNNEVDSDPFCLGPIIDKVMAQETDHSFNKRDIGF